MKKCIITLFILLWITLCFVYLYCDDNNKKLDKRYYEVNEIAPELNNIHNDLPAIIEEVKAVKSDVWQDWPEKGLYDGRDRDIGPIKTLDDPEKYKWNVYPFIAFGVLAKFNIKRCPKLWKFIQSVPGIKAALLSKLGPKIKLNEHRGWGNHSNHVIRCHFGFEVPKGCYVSVRNPGEDTSEIVTHKQHDWICFDDSKHHYAHNPTNTDRIVLILDIERPKHIKVGTSQVRDTSELKQIVDYFKNMK